MARRRRRRRKNRQRKPENLRRFALQRPIELDTTLERYLAAHVCFVLSLIAAEIPQEDAAPPCVAGGLPQQAESHAAFDAKSESQEYERLCALHRRSGEQVVEVEQDAFEHLVEVGSQSAEPPSLPYPAVRVQFRSVDDQGRVIVAPLLVAEAPELLMLAIESQGKCLAILKYPHSELLSNPADVLVRSVCGVCRFMTSSIAVRTAIAHDSSDDDSPDGSGIARRMPSARPDPHIITLRAVKQYIRGNAAQKKRGELQHRHFRRGHWRMVRCGPGRRMKKRVFVESTVVRPDKPPDHRKRKYRIDERSFC